MYDPLTSYMLLNTSTWNKRSFEYDTDVKNTSKTLKRKSIPNCSLVLPPPSYLYLGAVVRVLRRQQAGEAGLLRRRDLVLLLAGPVAVHAARVGVEPPPPPVAVERHVHRRVFLISRLRRHVRVGDPWPDRRRRSELKECALFKWKLNILQCVPLQLEGVKTW